jgi:hypothetical protein
MRVRRCFVPTLAALAALACGLPVVSDDKKPAPSWVGIVRTGKEKLDFRDARGLAATYHLGAKVAKPYFWPLNAPCGEAVTRAWPMGELDPGETKKDHIHQKSAWFCHGDVIPEGIKLEHKVRGVTGVDFWSEARGHGKIVCVKVGTSRVGPGSGEVTTSNEWRTADGVKILDETRTIDFRSLPEGRLFVLDIDLHASVCPITFADTKEGSMGVRVRDAMRADKKGKLTNAEGKSGEGKRPNNDRKGCWGLKSAWCDSSGPAGKKTAGIAVFSDPTNDPPSVWHVGNYGLMAANPFGRKHANFPDARDKPLCKLARGEHLKLRYGIFVHDGDVKEGKVAEAYTAFVKLRRK